MKRRRRIRISVSHARTRWDGGSLRAFRRARTKKIVPKLNKNEIKNGPPDMQNRAKMGARCGQDDEKIEKKRQDGEKTEKKHYRNIKKGGLPTGAPPFCPKKWSTWPQDGPQNGAKINIKLIQKKLQLK